MDIVHKLKSPLLMKAKESLKKCWKKWKKEGIKMTAETIKILNALEDMGYIVEKVMDVYVRIWMYGMEDQAVEFIVENGELKADTSGAQALLGYLKELYGK